MSKLPISILAAGLALAMAPAPALAASKNRTKAKDIAATRTYIQADYALVHTARINMKTGEAALEELRSTIGAACPRAALASPENEAAEKLSNEVIGAMSTVFIRADEQAVASFAATVEPLRWSNRKLTQKVTSYAGKLKALAALARPDICGDVRAWAANGYRTLPASTTQFDRVFSAEDVGIGEVPAHLLAPYVDHGERVTLQHTTQFENELVDAEARAVEPWSKILDGLNLQP
jgi:hypothetical protein